MNKAFSNLLDAVGWVMYKSEQMKKTVQSSSAAKKAAAKASTPSAPTQMVCPECGMKYPLDQVYCEECGSLLKAE